MQAQALAWFKWLHANQQLSSWEAFTWDPELCFELDYNETFVLVAKMVIVHTFLIYAIAKK